jgi:teichuronic acid biosynthesis glycosyltransferase TuaC
MSRPVRTLLVTNMYPYAGQPYYGSFVREFVEAMRERGHAIEVHFTNPRTSRRAYFTDLAPLRRRIRDGAFDLVHAQHTYSAYQVLAAGAALRRRPPLLLTLHEGEVHAPAETRDPDADLLKRLIYVRRLKGLAAERAERVVVVEQRMAEAVGRPDADVIPPAIDTGLFRPGDRAAARAALGIDHGRPIALFPANPERFEKRGDLLRQALPLLATPIEVLWGGKIPHDDMPTWMAAADVVVQTSQYEASPMVIKEALACDRPIVTTDVGDVRALLAGVAGCEIVEPTPAAVARGLERALAVTATRGRERLAQLGLDPASTCALYATIYRELVSGAA